MQPSKIKKGDACIYATKKYKHCSLKTAMWPHCSEFVVWALDCKGNCRENSGNLFLLKRVHDDILLLNGWGIPTVNNVTYLYLGVTFNRRKIWKQHFMYTQSKCIEEVEVIAWAAAQWTCFCSKRYWCNNRQCGIYYVVSPKTGKYGWIAVMPRDNSKPGGEGGEQSASWMQMMIRQVKCVPNDGQDIL
jgi:hypothetical protein